MFGGLLTTLFASPPSSSVSPSSPYCGVSFNRLRGKWEVRMQVNGKRRYLGLFDSPVDAATAYDNEHRALGLNKKTLRKLNFPTDEDVQLASRDEHDEASPNSSLSTSKFKGVEFDRVSGKWKAAAEVDGEANSLGSYNSEMEAAVAHDNELRAGRLDLYTLRNINFLMADDVKRAAVCNLDELEDVQPLSHKSPVLQARAKGVVERALSEPSSFEVKWLPQCAKADLVVRAADGSDRDEWVGLKVKATNTLQPDRFSFTKLDGCGGMVVVLIAFRDMSVWVIPGHLIEVKNVRITRGGKWDDFHADSSDLPDLLLRAWSEPEAFPRKSLSEWRVPTTRKQQLAQAALDLFDRLFASAGFEAREPDVMYTPVDMILDGDVRLKLKTLTSHPAATYKYPLLGLHRQQAGRVRPYDPGDFDALLIGLISADVVHGFFLIPMAELVRRHVVGFDDSAHTIRVYPPWSEPKSESVAQDQAWHGEFFVPCEQGAVDVERLQDLVDRCRGPAGRADEAL